MLKQFAPLFPRSFERYFEPFIGSAAVYFHLWNGGRIRERALLSDGNGELINVYNVVRNNVEELIRLLTVHQEKHGREYYYQIREQDRREVKLGDVERAARTLYLNKTCFNGLYRVNSRGEFNVPIGSYEKPRILDEKLLQSSSAALGDAFIETRDFRTIVDLAEVGDFIYFDPPYDPVSKTASFTAYTAGNFSRKDQEDLAGVFAELSEKGCYCMLSNSHTPFILDLYQGFKIETVRASRAINSDASGRGPVDEVVVLNY